MITSRVLMDNPALSRRDCLRQFYLLHGSQRWLWLFARREEKSAWEFKWGKRLSTFKISQRDVIEFNIAAINFLIGKKDVFAIRTQTRISITTFAFDRVDF